MKKYSIGLSGFKAFLVSKPVMIISAVLWFTTTGYLLTLLHAIHWVDHTPAKTVQTTSAIKKYLKSDKWNVIHYLDTECGCSRSVIKKLNQRERNQQTLNQDENHIVILLKGSQADVESLSKNSFQVIQWNGDQTELGITGVPLLTIYKPGIEKVYQGGYHRGSVTPFSKLEDKQILANLKSNSPQKTYKAIGCHVSKKYQKLLDPLGIKYVTKKHH